MTKSILILMACTPAALLAQGGAQRLGQPPWMAPRGQAGPITGKPLTGTEAYRRSQTLADGTHMDSSGTGKFYRDDAGRMRSDSGESAMIFDPVAGAVYTLMNGQKAYRQLPFPADAIWRWILAMNNGAGTAMSYEKSEGPEVGPKMNGGDGAEPPATTTLPAQTINGIWATGTRTTVNIPTGAAGNSQPVQSVREVWYSSDLGVVVKSTTSDPRYGTSTYTLTEVQKGAPDASLFRLPEGYIPLPTRNALPKQ